MFNVHDEPESPNEDEPESPNEGACFLIDDESESRNEGAYLRFTMNRNRQMRGRV